MKELLPDSKLESLNPFLDKAGILGVGERMKNANIPYAQRYPVLLPRSHPITDLIIGYEHLKNYRAGEQGTLYAVIENCWPIDGRNQTRRVIRRCIICTRMTLSEYKYKMGALPADRVTETRPFTNVGLDYCGSMYIREKRHRNQRKIKTYVAIFICVTTKAVYIELVSDLTTKTFIAALKRFIARKGKCRTIRQLQQCH
ncbi:hypothetical protein WN48_01698 [Eufriesea mexicana]|uniref:Uncharacterized protein n=1 Tax=Eufriesea mexicana TaxID=516756 RepID=A0A310S869_9HYME|nr:hypothetical protein WN48_01698 [Eufriesea mexicana]